MSMQMRARRWFILLGLVSCLAFGIASVAAQDDSCRLLVERALTELGWNCAETPTGAACYGHDFIAATFAAENDFFNPADQAPAAELLSLSSSPANISTGDWGIAQLNLPADLGSVAGVDAQTGLTLLLLGEAELLNLRLSPEVKPPELTFRGEPHNAPCDEATNALILHSARGLLTKVDINGVHLDFDGSIIAQQPAVNIITFIVVEGQLVSQNMNTSAGQALSILLDDEGVAQAYIPTRDASVRELKLFDVVEMALVALRGEGVPAPAPEDAGETDSIEEEVDAVAGETDAPTEEVDADAEATEEVSAPSQVTSAVAEEGVSEEVPPEESVGEEEEVGAEDGACQAGQLVRHTITSGETLFAIAQAYNSRVSDIVARNNVANVDLIQVGEELLIPCDSREPGQTTMGTLPAVNRASGAVCDSLNLDTVVAGEGMRTFNWSSVSGASSYAVSVWKDRLEIARYESAGAGTSLTGALPTDAEPPFSWSVEVWQGGTTLCTSAAALLDVDATETSGPVDPVPLGPVAISWICLAPGEIAVVWENMPAETETLTIAYRNRSGGRKQPLAVPGQDGRVVLAESYVSDGVVTLAPQGTVATLNPPEVYCG